MTTMPIHQLVYVSVYNVGRVDNAPAALRDILSSSRRNNAEARITGYLIFDGDTFIQILEGSKADISATLSRIEGDPRHRSVQALAWQTQAERMFPDWSMAGYLRSPDQEAIFRAHGITGKIDRSKLSGEQVLALAQALSLARGGRASEQREEATGEAERSV